MCCYSEIDPKKIKQSQKIKTPKVKILDLPWLLDGKKKDSDSNKTIKLDVYAVPYQI